MENALNVNAIITERRASIWSTFVPTALVFAGSIAMLLIRLQIGPAFISDISLMMLALASYILGGVLLLTNLYATSEMSRKVGLFVAALGVFFNLSSWLVRWVGAYDRELGILRASGNDATPWIFRYVPFANLYDLSLAFAFGAGITTLLLARRANYQMLAAFTLPLAALILLLARFIGGEFIDLPPVLDSYWRPIHVGVGSLSYGVALVCFAAAVIYLLKAGTKVESMAIWSSVFAIGVIGTVSKFSVFWEFVYRIGMFTPNPKGGKPFFAPFRLELPYAGPALATAGLLLAGVIVSYLIYIYRGNLTAKRTGDVLLKLGFVAQVASLMILIFGVGSITNAPAALEAQLTRDPQQYVRAGRAIAERQDLTAKEYAAITSSQFERYGRDYISANGPKMFLSLNTNPVEVAGLITALAGTFFVLLFSFKTDRLRERLPNLELLDGLMYKTACLTFAGLAMLLITGAIWANESWGRPWGFDSKETGVLVAWLTYAAFLHTRISRGWKGQSSAYFAIVGFLLVVFTYLGVSYLLPGLHSYA